MGSWNCPLEPELTTHDRTNGRDRLGIPGVVPAQPRRSGLVLGRCGQERLVDPAAAHHPGLDQSAVLPVVPRRQPEHLLQRPGPARRAGPGRAAGADLRLPRDRHHRQLQLCGTDRTDREVRRHPARARRNQRRPGADLPADDSRGGGGDAGLRPARRHPLGGVRRLRLGRTGQPDRRRAAEGDRLGVLWHRAEPGGGVQAAAGPGAGAGRPPARALRDRAAPAGRGQPRRAGSGMAGADAIAADPAGRLRRAGRHRPALHPLHLRNHRPAQGNRARQRRARGGAVLVDGQHLRPAAGRGDVHRQ